MFQCEHCRRFFDMFLPNEICEGCKVLKKLEATLKQGITREQYLEFLTTGFDEWMKEEGGNDDST